MRTRSTNKVSPTDISEWVFLFSDDDKLGVSLYDLSVMYSQVYHSAPKMLYTGWLKKVSCCTVIDI